MKTIYILLILLICISEDSFSQTVLTLDYKSNTIKRTNLSSVDDSISIDTLLKNYIKKQPNSTFKLEKDIYKNALSKQIQIGDYLIFEITNFYDNENVDSIFISYNFFDRNVQEYGSVFQNILNRGLNQFETSEGGQDQNKDSKDDPSRKPASLKEAEIQDLYNSQYALLSIYAKADSVPFDEVIDTINNQFGLINNFEKYSPSQERDTFNQFVVSALCSVYQYDFPEQELVDELNEKFEQSFTKEELKLYVSESLKKEAEKRNDSDNNKVFLNANKKDLIFVPLQIPNKDITYIYLEGFKGNKRVYERPFILHNRGGFKVDFSAGFMTSFLRNNSYVLKDTILSEEDSDGVQEEITNKKIIRSDEGDFFVGIGVLAHFYKRWGKRLNGSLSTGFMLNTDSQVNYLFGISSILGLEQRLVLSGGLSVGRVTDLSSLFEEGDLISSDISVLPERNVWRTGLFIGVSYNF